MLSSRFREAFEVSKGNLWAGVICGLLVAFFGGFILVFPAFFHIGEFFSQASYNIPFILKYRYLGAEVNEAVIVFMDEEAHDQLHQPYNRAWDRAATHAKLVERLTADGARAIVFDIVFSDPSVDPAEDDTFAAALKRAPNVVLAGDNVPQTQSGAGQQFQIATEKLLNAVTARDTAAGLDEMAALQRHIGIDELHPDSDLAVRVHPGFSTNDLFYPLSWVAARLLNAPSAADPRLLNRVRWVNYYGPDHTIPSVSYWKALAPGELKPGFFKDKVVFIGSSLLTRASGERKDAYRSIFPRKFTGTVIENTPQVSGVEIQATLLLNMLRGDWLLRPTNRQHFAVVTGSAFLFSVGLMLLRPSRAVTMGSLIALAFAVMGCLAAIYFELIVAWLIPVLCIGLGTLGSVAFNSYRLHLQRKLLQQSVAMYVSPAVAASVLRQPDMMKPGARKEMLSIMFTDIANFTNMSEGMDSDALAHLMNGYFETAVNRCIHPMEGTVVKYIGDAIFSIWNAPIPQENHRELACRAAILLRDQVTDFEINKPGLEVRTRIGLHSGTASVGNFGSTNRVDYTALGENINLTSRMEGLNKYLGTSILATGDIIEPVESKFTSRFIGQFQLKGFARAVDVYELIGEAGAAESTRILREQFAEAHEAFCRRDFDKAELAFKRVLQLYPKDGPSKFYLSHINDFRATPPFEAWKGEIELKEK